VRLLLVIAAAVLLAVSVTGTASSKPVSCGVIGVTHARYLVRVEQGKLTCATALSGMRRFIATGQAPQRWICFRGHSGQRWAAGCAVNGAIVRAYLR
jgi:hypothetical protein